MELDTTTEPGASPETLTPSYQALKHGSKEVDNIFRHSKITITICYQTVINYNNEKI